MNGTVKGLLIFAVGVGVGAFAAVTVVKKKYEILAEEEIQSVKETYKNGLEKKKAELIKAAEGVDEISSSVTSPERIEKVRKNNYKKIVGKLGYAGRNDELVEEDEEEKYKYEKLSTGNMVDDYVSDLGAKVITFDQYMEENDHYQKDTIYYYEDDEVLTDENEEIIVDQVAVIGKEALYNFGSDSGDPEVVYIRNNKMQIDYEVIRLSKSYKETVLGDTGKDGDD